MCSLAMLRRHDLRRTAEAGWQAVRRLVAERQLQLAAYGGGMRPITMSANEAGRFDGSTRPVRESA